MPDIIDQIIFFAPLVALLIALYVYWKPLQIHLTSTAERLITLPPDEMSFSVIVVGGFKSQPQQLMFGSGFSEFHIEQEFAVNLYR